MGNQYRGLAIYQIGERRAKRISVMRPVMEKPWKVFVDKLLELKGELVIKDSGNTPETSLKIQKKNLMTSKLKSVRIGKILDFSYYKDVWKIDTSLYNPIEITAIHATSEKEWRNIAIAAIARGFIFEGLGVNSDSGDDAGLEDDAGSEVGAEAAEEAGLESVSESEDNSMTEFLWICKAFYQVH